MSTATATAKTAADALSRYARAIRPSATLAAAAKAKELKARGIEVFDFGVGEPDFATPTHIGAAAQNAITAGKTHYTPVAGIPELRTAIANYHRQQHQVEYRPEQICASTGAKQSIYLTLLTLVDPGTEVLLPAPYWTSYYDLIEMVGGKPVVLPTTAANGFRITPAELQAVITPQTRLLILNSPSNPTGAVYHPDQLRELAEVLSPTDVWILSDEIYERLIYDGTPFQSFASLSDRLKERTITINGVSKTYAMTGWRLGWAAGPTPIIQAISAIQSQHTSNPCSITQYAALEALSGDQSNVAQMHLEFQKRWQLVCKRLPQIPGVAFRQPGGAFYAFFDICAYFGKRFQDQLIQSSQDFCQLALEHAHVNLVAGSAFGAEGFARLSFVAAPDTIERGLHALDRWVREIQ